MSARTFPHALCAAALAAIWTLPALAGPFPDGLAYRGQAVDANGAPLEGVHEMALRYFDAAGSEELLAETHTGVRAEDGRFEIKLGGGELRRTAAYAALVEVFAGHPEVLLEVTISGRLQSPRVKILPAGHSLKSRLVAAGERQPEDGKPHWKHYEHRGGGSAIQAAVLGPAGTGGPSAGAEARQGGPFLTDVIGPFLSRPVRDLPTLVPVGEPAVDDNAINPPRHEQLFDAEGYPFGTRTRKIDDPLAAASAEDEPRHRTPDLLIDFEGTGNVNGVLPPDTEGAVGLEHFVQMVNLSFAIYEKDGTLVAGPVNTNTLWSGFGGPCENNDNGDPIALYDWHADRWVLTQFAISGAQAVCFAVSQTSDPTGAYFLYQINAQRFPDYFKLGAWPDPDNNAYFMATNTGFPGQYDVYAIDRANCLAGAPARPAQFFQSYPNLIIPADIDGDLPPPAGSPGLFFTMRDGGETYFSNPPPATDSIDLYAFDVDWSTPASSTFELIESFVPPQITDFNWTVCGFFSQNCLPQPGTGVGLDSFSWWPMQRFVYRNFGSHETLLGTWTVDTAAAGNHAAPRWFELRNSGARGSSWEVHQEGTHAPDALHRWMPSIGMDRDGNIAMGYSVVSESVFPSLRYTTRSATDPPGTLDAEKTLIDGSGSQTSGSNRWGDYASMDVDPVDDCTFWFTSEYIVTTGNSPWRTRIGAFEIPGCGGLQVDPTAQSVCSSAGSAEYAVTLFDLFPGTTDLTLTGCPASASCAYSPNPIVFPQTESTLTVSGLGGVAADTYGMTVTATDMVDPAITRDVPISLDLFTIVPAAPAPSSPASGATGVGRQPTLEWSAVAQAVTYTVEVATDAAFTNIVDSATVNTSSYTVSGGLDPLTEYFWRVLADNVCGTSAFSATFSFTTLDVPEILLVDDDDNGPDMRATYTATLDALGKQYDVWDTANSDTEPSEAFLAPYRIVIWFTGDEFGGSAGPGGPGEAALAAWLDGTGSCLFLSSQDYHFDRGLTPFMTGYLGVSSIANDTDQNTVTGTGSVFGGLGPYNLSFPFTDFSDTLTVGNGGELAWIGDQGNAGVTKEDGYRTLYFVFPFVTLPAAADREAVLDAAFGFCGTGDLFADGFESGNTAAWSQTSGG